MSRAKAKTAPKAGQAEMIARMHSDKVADIHAQVTKLARALFELYEDRRYRGDLTKPLRLAFDLGPATTKMMQDAERAIESAKWEDRQPDLPLDDNEDE